ncbi:MAG: NAD-dependent epimerase/dehydratase family protein [Acetobacteraceae bacterium]|nr:NAD-dependent epimerase/dehydratase family protein [Acetobacteraceae bacterium]
MPPRAILLTGGCGFIGSHLVDALLEAGHRVVVVDDLSTGCRENLNPQAGFFPMDVASPALSRLFARERPELVVHLAAQVSVTRSLRRPALDAHTNLLGTLNLLECCRRAALRGHPVRRVVFLSSAAVYGEPAYLPIDESHLRRPHSPYGLHKRVAEEYLSLYRQRYGLDSCTLICANVYGPRQRPSAGVDGAVVPSLLARLGRGRPGVIYGDGEQTRDFVYVEDVARACVLALERGSGGATLNLGTGRETSINRLHSLLAGLAGVRAAPLRRPARPADIRRSCLNGRRAAELLGWEPRVGLEEGLARTWEWWQAAGDRGR